MPPARLRPLALALAAALSCAGGRGALAPAAPAAGAEVNRSHAIALDAAPGPAGGEVEVEITEPDGRRIRRAAFPVEHGLEVRVRPRAPGLHRWVALAGGAEVARGAFDAAPSRRAGAARVAAEDPRTLALAGAAFRPLGENRMNVYDPSWNPGNATTEAYLAAMAARGMNALRIFLFLACRDTSPPTPACLEPRLGRFDPAAAREIDRVLDAAEAHGLKVVLTVFAIGFTPGDAWKGWEMNPYSAARGGPAATNQDFFTSPEARRAALRRLRYALARWGASPALLAVDLLNEPEWDGAIPERRWIPWARALGAAWKAEDPYGTLVTAGPVGLHWNVEQDERAWWAAPENDLVQWHRYGPDVYEVHALARALAGTVEDTRRYRKPVLVGEFAWGGEAKPLYDHTHVGLWAATFAGAGVLAHTAPPFTIDSDEPMTDERARHFLALSRFVAALGPAPTAPLPRPAAAPAGALALAMSSGDAAALWLLGPEQGYGDPVQGASVTVRGLAPGAWRVRWQDDVTGAPVGEADGLADELRGLELRVPPFVRHVAARLERTR